MLLNVIACLAYYPLHFALIFQKAMIISSGLSLYNIGNFLNWPGDGTLISLVNSIRSGCTMIMGFRLSV